MKIVAFGASTSRQSINKQLASYAASLVPSAEVEVLDLNDFDVPLFSQDKEAEIGQPDAAKAFLAKLDEADALVISFAEHNGSYSAAYKNLFDWASRIRQKVYQDKSVVLLSTSPGPGGAKTVLAAAAGSAPYFGADVKSTLSIPSFYDNFNVEQGKLSDPELEQALLTAVAALV
uniref:NADPH-dependent FMN reductase n=1 Tax=Thaumasiovibrio occultus TaxID=1891184 RepID=UPI000B352B68|nr:NADPH-dependent FMN reductase [Thaumasiovibrio occultus]